MLVLSVSDVFAAIVGRELGKPSRGLFARRKVANKSRAGTFAFFLSSLVIVTVSYTWYGQASIIYALGMGLVISLAATLGEALSSKGFDNFFIPAIILIIMYLEVLL